MVAALIAEARAAAADRPRTLAAARAALSSAPPLAKASLEAARYRLQLGLLSADLDEMAAGWRDFLQLYGSAPSPTSKHASERVRTVLASGIRRDAADADRLRLVQLLIRAGFAIEADWLVPADAVTDVPGVAGGSGLSEDAGSARGGAAGP